MGDDLRAKHDKGSQGPSEGLDDSSSEGGADDQPESEAGTPPRRLDPDPRLAELLREASESDSERSRSNSPLSDSSTLFKTYARRRKPKSTGPIINIAVLALACWTLRIPAIYADFIQ
jgi:RNA polymerase I-specific transcription initiation factor RRN7